MCSNNKWNYEKHHDKKSWQHFFYFYKYEKTTYYCSHQFNLDFNYTAYYLIFKQNTCTYWIHRKSALLKTKKIYLVRITKSYYEINKNNYTMSLGLEFSVPQYNLKNSNLQVTKIKVYCYFTDMISMI